MSPFVLKMNNLQQWTVLHPVINGIKRQPENFAKPEYCATKLLRLIHEFAPHKGTVSDPRGLLSKDVQTLFSLFKQVAHTMLALLDTREGKCVEVSSPAYIIG